MTTTKSAQATEGSGSATEVKAMSIISLSNLVTLRTTSHPIG